MSNTKLSKKSNTKLIPFPYEIISFFTWFLGLTVQETLYWGTIYISATNLIKFSLEPL